jgi:hypothetical protein
MTSFKVIGRVCLIVLFFTAIYSCNKGLKDQTSTRLLTPRNEKFMTDQEIVQTYSQIGVWHNRALELIYNDLNQKFGKISSLQRTESATVTLLELNQKAGAYLIDSLSLTGLNVESLYCTDTAFLDPDKFYKTTSFISHCESINDIQFEMATKTSMDQLESIFRSDTTNGTSSSYDSLISIRLPLISSQTDKSAFVATANVLRSSYQYWSENYAKWDTLIDKMYGTDSKNSILNKKSLNEIIKDMVFADGSGAFSGLIYGAGVGAVGGTIVIPGIGTVTGAAVCALAAGFIGGATSSAGAVLSGLIQHLINW